MITKVLTGEEAQPAEPISWHRLSQGEADARQAARSEPESARETQLAALTAHIKQLEGEIEGREQRAYAAGFRKGEAAGQEQASARLDPVVQRFVQTIEELPVYRRKLRRDAEEDVVRLALAIARRILRRELSVDPEALLGVVKAALEGLEGREADRVRMNPEDAALTRRHFEQAGISRRLEILADERLERGAVIFETPRGNLDASVDTQLQEIHRGLVDRLDHQS